MSTQRIIVWYSDGAASAVAGKLMVEKYGSRVELLKCDTSASEHPDNVRFRADVERWVGVPVKLIRHPRFSTVEEVFEKERYMSGVAGAKCTVELKKRPRFAYQRADDRHVFGLTADEGRRITQFEGNNPELILEWPLRDVGLTKADCLARITAAGIELPVMYRLGFANNNCLGCVKSQSPAYWNQIRAHFPEVFARRAEQSRRLGVRLVKVKGVRVFLDELASDSTEVIAENLSCGPQCASAD
jgi:hypothetical protein